MGMFEIFWERSLAFFLFWGIWMLAPLTIDLIMAVFFIVLVYLYPEKKERKAIRDLAYLPHVSIIVPVHNSGDTLFKCLYSIVKQHYPLEKIQVICVNNGSTDNSFQVYCQFQDNYPLVHLHWISTETAGKSNALNAGIYLIKGDYVINVDSDSWLDEYAVLRMVESFENDPDLIAATGSIHIDKELGKNTRFMDIVHYCEEIEYLVSFNVGRRYQSLTNNLFTLAGAFSAFRRDVILKSFQYSERTVSEDTDLTFHLRQYQLRGNARMACISSAIAYVEPISSATKLYSQRVRWQRGEIEVVALYTDAKAGFKLGLSSFAGRLLIMDHTMAFSRMTWTFLIPFLYFLGYPMNLVMAAFLGLYICYLVLDILYYLIAIREAPPGYQGQVKKIWWVIFFLPIFRFFTFWFRLSGIIISLTEPAAWKTVNPVQQLIDALKGTKGYWMAKVPKRRDCRELR
jgi:biofilm PGA synthesis N-glycosyltransferase PgaC